MSYIKSKIFLEFSKTQKSALCNFLRALVKKSPDFSVSEIVNKFIEDETYYFEVNNPHFEFLKDIIFEDSFKNEIKLYVEECKKYYNYKASQQSIIEKQKEFNKKKRKFAQELKMKHEKPTQKQLYYYERLCKKYNIEKKETKDLSKLDLKNMIGEILDEYSRNCEHINICGD